MRIEVRADSGEPTEADVLAIPVGPEGVPENAGVEAAARVADEEGLAAEAGRTAVLYEGPARRVVVVGMGRDHERPARVTHTSA